jgi:hypothetical protein
MWWLLLLACLFLGCATPRSVTDWTPPSPNAPLHQDFVECQQKAYSIVGTSPGWGDTPYYTWHQEKENIVDSCIKAKGYTLR